MEVMDSIFTLRRVAPSIIDARAQVPLHCFADLDVLVLDLIALKRRGRTERSGTLRQGRANAVSFAPVAAPDAMTTYCFPAFVLYVIGTA